MMEPVHWATSCAVTAVRGTLLHGPNVGPGVLNGGACLSGNINGSSSIRSKSSRV